MKKLYLTVKMLNLIIFLLLFLTSLSTGSTTDNNTNNGSSSNSPESSSLIKIVSLSPPPPSSLVIEEKNFRQKFLATNKRRDGRRRLSPPPSMDDDSEEEEELATYFSKSKSSRRPLTYRSQSSSNNNKSSSKLATIKDKLSLRTTRNRGKGDDDDDDDEDILLLRKLIAQKKLASTSSSSTTDLHRGLPVYDHLAHGTNHHMLNHGNMIHPTHHHHSKYPQYALDPASPLVLTHTQHNPLAPFNPANEQHTQQLAHPGLPTPQKKKRKKDFNNSLLPLDKNLLYFGVVFGGLFWAIVAACFYNWGDKVLPSRVSKLGYPSGYPGGTAGSYPSASQQRPIVVKVEPGKPPEYLLGRSLPGSSFSFTDILDMISMAQETYEKFDFQSLPCQKKALCELQQKKEDFGETGRKITSTLSFVDVLEGLPMPTIIQSYLREYREAIMQGKNSTKECSSIYPTCNFSVKEIFVKYYTKRGNNKLP